MSIASGHVSESNDQRLYAAVFRILDLTFYVQFRALEIWEGDCLIVVLGIEKCIDFFKMTKKSACLVRL